jgi:hypothetical protein
MLMGGCAALAASSSTGSGAAGCCGCCTAVIAAAAALAAARCCGLAPSSCRGPAGNAKVQVPEEALLISASHNIHTHATQQPQTSWEVLPKHRPGDPECRRVRL